MLKRHALLRGCAAILLAAGFASKTSATIVFTDGFGDGDRNNNGLDAGATATDPSDVGIPWFTTAGTSAITFQATDDSAGIGNGNALQIFNTGSNNRPEAGMFTPVTLGDGDKLILRFDMRLLSCKNTAGADITADRAVRFGLYSDKLGNFSSGDKASADTSYNDDDGYNCTIDARADAGANATMDVRRDADDAQILQAAAAGISCSTSNTAYQLVDANKHHFELSLTRSGTSLIVSLAQDGLAPITGTDASPVPANFTFNEVALGVRSSAAMDTRWDNIQVEYQQAVPEPAGLGIIATFTGALIARRRRR
jgi:hypothetical protein